MLLKNHPDVLTGEQVMKLLSISRNTLYHLIATKQIPAFRLGSRCWRFRKDDIERFLDEVGK